MTECEWQRRLGDFFVETDDDRRAIAAYRKARATPGCLDAAALQAARMALGDAALRLHDPGDGRRGLRRNRPAPRAHNRALALLALGGPGRRSTKPAGRWPSTPTTPTPGSPTASPANAWRARTVHRRFCLGARQR